MNMPKILEDFIARYFSKKLMPGILENYRRLQKKYAKQSADNPKAGEDFYVASFGYQTSFMMRWMSMAFAAVCVILLVIALVVNPVAFIGLRIFGTFLVLCVILWLLSYAQSGFIVYTPDWIYIQRPGKRLDYGMDKLCEMKVKGKLTLYFTAAASGNVKAQVPLEGALYMDFMNFLEKNAPQIVEKIPKEQYQRAMKKHGSAWGNRM